MGMEWTKQQQQVITLRERNILVSAAAGSGKTAVLVERIITRLLDEKHPIDVDRLLIVTFTEAAASEMKERIRGAIESALEKNPGNVHLQRQATLIHSALITTIHSFCLSVIREHFHVIDLDPGFRIAEEGELKLLKKDVLRELLEEKYVQAEKTFLEATEYFSNGRDDKKLEELILQLYEYSRSYPDAGEWIAGLPESYHVDENGTYPFLARALDLVAVSAGDALELLEEAMDASLSAAGPYMYEEMLCSDMEQIQRIKDADTFEEMYFAVQGINWMRLSAKKDSDVDPEVREYAKGLRNGAKDIIADLGKQFFYAAPEELAEDMERCYLPMKTLAGLVAEYGAAFAAKKSSKNIIDFGDMEQFALQILNVKKDGILVPSKVAAEYQEQFAEIMIDEYQDSNLIQEAILTSVSTISRGKNNLFMVGDVKQSIYRFRLSRPELFMEKFDTYSLEESDAQRIDLHKNFRSRAEVLDCVNHIFYQIMTKSLGGIVYDESAALNVGAGYEPQLDASGHSINQTEVLIVDGNLEEENVEDTPEIRDSVRELEARAVARRIKELLLTNVVEDRETGQYRKAAYRDIVILTRSIKGWTDTFSRILNEEGIPTYAGNREGYFETYEVSVLLDYLRILDNMQQDLPMAAVLTSSFGNLGADELAKIRSAFPEKSFACAVTSYIEEMEHAESAEGSAEMDSGQGEATGKSAKESAQSLDWNLGRKLKNICNQIAYFRSLIPYQGIHELLWRIIEETGYGDYVAAMPGGEQRKANVDMLVEKAIAFENTSYKGLFNFVRYIEQLQKYDVDYGEASVLDEQNDAVRLMSIHKSKGLEFPIVFVAGMGKRFNTQDVTSSLVIHPDLGVGIDAIDLEKRTKAVSILKKVIQKEVNLDNLGEELRVLYVALTRAKEKLIMVGALSGAAEKLAAFENICHREKTELSFSSLSGARSYFDWVLPALVRIPKDLPLRVDIITPMQLVVKETVETYTADLTKEVLLNWNEKKVFDEKMKNRLEDQFSYVYPYSEENQLKLKFTVSELKKRIATQEAEEAGEEMYREPEKEAIIPGFLQTETLLTGASRGTAYHKLMELLDFSKDYDEPQLRKVIEAYRQEGKMSREMAECIDTADILAFLGSSSAKRMQKAASAQKLWSEQPFVLGVDAKDVYPETKSEQIVLVQGIIDVYFEEEEGLVVLDYKTDKVRSAQELRERYHGQLDYYARALEQITGKRVSQKIIYSFTLQEEIVV
ncbi:MAG: helicase-exonuclease AddAB subunit AddA [Hespellia sp.]|nr:helicase-exonuclease AddAB subunit AddA [Hespellia sp.]